MRCIVPAPGTISRAVARVGGLASCVAVALMGAACPQTTDWGRLDVIIAGWIPVVAGNPPSWLAEASVAPVVRVDDTGSSTRALLYVEQERLPYRIVEVNLDEARQRLALLSAADLATIRSAINQLVANFGPRTFYGAWNIAEVKMRTQRAVDKLAACGAAASLRMALMGKKNNDDVVILRLEDEPAGIYFAVFMKGDQVLAGACDVKSIYYAKSDLLDRDFRPGIELDSTIDLFEHTRDLAPWTRILYSLARPIEDLPEEMREAMDAWCREPIGVRKASGDRE